MQRVFWHLAGTMLLFCLAAPLARAAEAAAEGAEKIPVDGPVLMPFQPAYRNQASEDADAKPESDQENPTSETGPKLTAAEPTSDKTPAKTEPKTDKKPAETKPVVEKAEPKEEPRATQPAPVRRELTPPLAALRDRVRRTLAVYFNQPLNTEASHAGDVLVACRAFGCQTEVVRGGQKINAVTCLCWNYPCAGLEPLIVSDGRIAARVGYGRQSRAGQMLGVFALSRVPGNYPLRVGEDVRTVMDLVEAEKRACREGADQSLRLLGLSFYVEEPKWKNDLGESWSLDKLVLEELEQPIVNAPEGGTLRLMALSGALRDRVRRDQPLDGPYARAVKFTADFHKFALDVQNSDGSWSHEYFAARGPARDVVGQLAATGRISEWLAYSVDDERLTEPRIAKAIESVTNLLNSQRYQGSTVRALNSLELDSVTHALHALSIYDERVFKPVDPPKTASPAPSAKTAGGSRQGRQ